ncbi:MAG: hypothetical protein R3181_08535 [Rubricoccaceae bacterium]|nr:hypothetical protein [Rubricoccaceae bacterium]
MRSLILPLALLVAPALSLNAQPSGAPGAPLAIPPPTCPSIPDDRSIPLGFYLEPEVVDHLAKKEESVFVRAYLLSLLAEEATPGNVLRERARTLDGATFAQLIGCKGPPAGAFDWSVPTVREMVDALDAEAERQRRLRLAAERTDADSFLNRLTVAPDRPADQLLALRDDLAVERERYRSRLFADALFDPLRARLDDALALAHRLPIWFAVESDLRRAAQGEETATAAAEASRGRLDGALQAWANAAVAAADEAAAAVRPLADDPGLSPARRAAAEDALQLAEEVTALQDTLQVQLGNDDQPAARGTSDRLADALRRTIQRAAEAQGDEPGPTPPDLPEAAEAAWQALGASTTRLGIDEAAAGAAQGALRRVQAAHRAVQQDLAALSGLPGPTAVDAEAVAEAARARLDAVRLEHATVRDDVTLALQDPVGVTAAAGALSEGRSAPALAPLAVEDAPERLRSATPPIAPEQVLWALTDLLYERAQEELTLDFVYRLRGWFQETETGAALALAFPRTAQIFSSSELLLFELPRAAWRDALRADIRALPHALTLEPPVRGLVLDLLYRDEHGVVAGDTVAGCPPARPSGGSAAGPAPLAQRRTCAEAYLDALGLTVGLAERLMAGASPFDVAIALSGGLRSHEVAGRPLLRRLGLRPEDTARVLGAASLMADVARDLRLQGGLPPADANPAELPDHLLSLSQFDTAAPTLRRLYVNLLVLSHLQPLDTPTHPLPPALDLPALTEAVRQVVHAFELAQDRLTTLPSSATDRASAYGSYVGAALDQSIATLELADVLLGAPPSGADAPLRLLRTRWEDVGAIYAFMASGAYPDALSRTVLLFSGVTGSPMPDRLHRVASLAATVASARSGTEMEAAFRAAARPAGGFRGKRNDPGSPVTINAYVGLGLDTELLFADGTRAGPWTGVAAPGVALPLGLEWHRPFGVPLSLFLPVLDLGAPLSYRLARTRGVETDDGTDGEVEQLPTLTLRQVLAPGVLVVAGPRQHPFALGLGVQFYPGLREVEPADGASGASTDPLDALHVGVLLGVDLTLFQF